MPIQVSCACGAALRVPDTLAGRKVRCPKCKGVLQVPAAAPAPDVVIESAPAAAPPAPKGPRRRGLGEPIGSPRRPRPTADPEGRPPGAASIAARMRRQEELEEQTRRSLLILGIVLIAAFMLPMTSGYGMVWPWQMIAEISEAGVVVVLIVCWPLLGGLAAAGLPRALSRHAACGICAAVSAIPFLLILGVPNGAEFYGSVGGWRILMAFAGVVLAGGGALAIRKAGADTLPQRLAGIGGALMVGVLLIPVETAHFDPVTYAVETGHSLPLIEAFTQWQSAILVLGWTATGAMGIVTFASPDDTAQVRGSVTMLALYLTMALGVIVSLVELSRGGGDMQGLVMVMLLKVFSYLYGMILLGVIGLAGVVLPQEGPEPA